MSSASKKTEKGPPKHIKARQYHPTLQLLEQSANDHCIQEYVPEIYQTMAMTETQNSTINCAMIDLQPEIAWYMRPALLDFLIDVHNSLRLQHETLFLTIFILDNYCAKRVVFKKHYQLVGCTALWIASKYEDKKSRVPTLNELKMMCRDIYDQDMFVQMEMHILSTLNWNLAHTSLEDCLQICIKNSTRFIPETPSKHNDKSINKQELNHQIEQLSRFFMELTLYERNFIQFPNSLTATTCHLLAANLLNSSSAINSFEASISSFYEQQQQQFNQFGGEDEDDDFFIENDENQYPMNNVIPPFFSGWNEDESIESIFKILILLIIQLVNLKEVSHVLPAKYPEFQILLQNFIKENTLLLSYLNVNSNILNNASEFKVSQAQSQACHHLIGLATDDEEEVDYDEEDDSYDLYAQYTSSEFSKPTFVHGQQLPLTPPSASSAMFSDNQSFSSYSSSSPITQQMFQSMQPQQMKSIFFQSNNDQIPTPIEPVCKAPHVPSIFSKHSQDFYHINKENHNQDMPNSSPLASKSRGMSGF